MAADLISLMKTQRACRAFLSEPVSDATIGRVLDAAVHAPSAENSQPWEFIVVRDAERRARIGDLMARAWQAHGRDHSRDRLSAALFADVDVGLSGGIAAAPVLIVVAVDRRRCHAANPGSSIFPAVQNLLLAAAALGLGSALTTIATVYGDELRFLVGLPAALEPVAVIPLGVPTRKLGPPRREPFARHTHREGYGQPWEGSTLKPDLPD